MPSNNSLFAVLLCIIIFTFSFAIYTEPQTISNQYIKPINYFPYIEKIYMPTNLAPIPTAWGINVFSNLFLDTSVIHIDPSSIRVEPKGSSDNTAREVWGPIATVQPGDHVVASCWIKIDALPSGYAAEEFAGARIGIDMRNRADGRGAYCLASCEAATYPETDEMIKNHYVHYGDVGWFQRTIDFIVPATYFTLDLYTSNTLAPTQINSVSFWMQVWSSTYGPNEPGNGWFTEPSLVITPVDEAPLVTPSFSDLSLSDATVLVDEPVSCNVTLTGGGGVPTGSVTFYVATHDYLDVWNQLGVAVTLDAGGSVSSVSFRPGLAGIYLFRAEYSGDTVYTDFSSTDTLLTVNNPVTVTQLDNGVLRMQLARMEKKSIGTYVFEPDVLEPGLDNDNSTRRLMEKKQ